MTEGDVAVAKLGKRAFWELCDATSEETQGGSDLGRLRPPPAMDFERYWRGSSKSMLMRRSASMVSRR